MIYENDYEDLFFELLAEVEKQKKEEIKKKLIKEKEEIINNGKEELEKNIMIFLNMKKLLYFVTNIKKI